MTRKLKFVLIGAAVLLILALMLGCGEKSAAPTAVEPGAQTSAWTMDNPLLRTVAAVQERFTPELMKNPEVVGTAV
ncbi:MAG TPA: hypothetical protein PLF89_03000, partial [bacterium]|nr:hypothetical protein [bacterium]